MSELIGKFPDIYVTIGVIQHAEHLVARFKEQVGRKCSSGKIPDPQVCTVQGMNIWTNYVWLFKCIREFPESRAMTEVIRGKLYAFLDPLKAESPDREAASKCIIEKVADAVAYSERNNIPLYSLSKIMGLGDYNFKTIDQAISMKSLVIAETNGKPLFPDDIVDDLFGNFTGEAPPSHDEEDQVDDNSEESYDETLAGETANHLESLKMEEDPSKTPFSLERVALHMALNGEQKESAMILVMREALDAIFSHSALLAELQNRIKVECKCSAKATENEKLDKVIILQNKTLDILQYLQAVNLKPGPSVFSVPPDGMSSVNVLDMDKAKQVEDPPKQSGGRPVFLIDYDSDE